MEESKGKRLEGGFINEVYLREDGVVVKIYCGDELVGIPSLERIKNEAMALKIFGGVCAPPSAGKNY